MLASSYFLQKSGLFRIEFCIYVGFSQTANEKLRQMCSAKGFSFCLFVFLLTRYILRCFVLESILCCMNLDFCVVRHTLGWLPEIFLFPCVHLNTPESALPHQRTKKKMQERNLTLVHALHSTFLPCLFFPPVFHTLLIKFWEKAQRSSHLVDPRCSTLGVCVSACVPNTANGDSLTHCLRIVEANPRKFNLDATELGIRKAFITSTRQVVRVRNVGLGWEHGEGRGSD